MREDKLHQLQRTNEGRLHVDPHMVFHRRIVQRQVISEGVCIVHQHIDAAPAGDRLTHSFFRMLAIAGKCIESNCFTALGS